MTETIHDRAAGTTRTQRLTTLSAVIALHLSLLLLLIARWTSNPEIARTSGPVSVLALDPAEPAQSQPPPRTMPGKLIDRSVPLESLIFSETPDPNASLTAVGSCATLDSVVAALLADQRAVQAVLGLPREARSIADAVVIWNVGWSDAASAEDSPLAATRASVEMSLSLVPEHCLDEPIAGPRLVPIPDGDGTRFLVIGSGNWTWRQLVDSPKPPIQFNGDPGTPSLADTLRRLFGN